MKKLISIFFCAVCLTTIVRGQTNNSDAYKKLYNEGNFKEAITAISKIDTTKRTAEDWFYLAQSYNSYKELLPAIDAYKQAVRLNPGHNGFKLSYARALNQAGNTDAAVANLNEIIGSDSTNLAALSDIGSIYLNSKKFNFARAAYEKLLEQNSSDFLSHYYLALAVYNMNASPVDSETVPNHLVHCLINNPRFTPARDLLGNYYFARQQYKRALTEYEAYSFYKKDDAEINFKIGLTLEKLKNYSMAIPSYEKAVKIDSTVANYFSHLGYCYYVENKYDSSANAYSIASALDKDNPTVFQNLGMAYLKLDSLEAAKRAFEAALANFGLMQMTFIINQVGYIDIKQSKFEEARIACEKVLALEPENVFATYNLARVYDEQKKNAQALKLYKKSVVLMKNIPTMESEYKFAARRSKELEK
jgi:tetratricopeptide (TPR) repeat protein